MYKRAQWLAVVLAVAAIYCGAARLGFAIAFVHGTVSAVWPPTGVALAVLVIGGPRLWPAILLGELASDLINGSPGFVSLAFAVGSTCEALAGWALLRRVRFRPELDRIRDVFALLGLAALLSTVVSATIATATLLIAGTISVQGLWATWHVWWLGDVTGDVIVAPLLMVLAKSALTRPSAGRIVEVVAFALTLTALAAVAHELTLGIAYLVLPVLIWASLRFAQQGAVIANAVLAGVGVVAAAGAASELSRVSIIERVLFTQNFVVVGAITTLVLAAMIAERDRASEALRDSEAAAGELARERTALSEIATAIARELPQQRVLALIGEHATALLGARRCEIAGPGESVTAAATHTVEIRAGRRRLGTLAVLMPDARGLGESDVELLDRLADLASLAITGAEARERLLTEASTDGLTGLANRRAFRRGLAREIKRARRYERPLALVLCDVDHFKAVNDAAGHHGGDEVLVESARRITAAVRTDALVARLGGDELAILLPESDGIGAYAAAERIRQAIFEAPIAGLSVTISAGVADLAQGASAKELLHLGDTALYAAKRLGGNAVVRYSEALAADAAGVHADAGKRRPQPLRPARADAARSA